MSTISHKALDHSGLKFHQLDRMSPRVSQEATDSSGESAKTAGRRRLTDGDGF